MQRAIIFTALLSLVTVFALVGGCATEPTDPDAVGEQAVAGCGVERWSVKTGTDADVAKVDLAHVQDTTVSKLTALTAPVSPPSNNRVAPTETTLFRLRNVTLQGFKLETDSDVHLILSDGTSSMNGEIAAPSCVGTGSPFEAHITSARAAFVARHTPTTSFTTVSETVTVVGVGFFDFLHGQTGGAPNGAELHPILDMCFGADCTLSGGLGGDGGAGDGGVDGGDGGADGGGAGGLASVKNVFVVLMENHNWSAVKGSASAPYINGTLLPMSAHAESYVNLPGIHPSEPNYIWLEAGDNLGITTDSLPSTNHQATTSHLVTQLEAAGVTWKAYAEGITGSTCPVSNSGLYAPKHVPFVFFDDVRTNASRCTSHVRPFAELATDLANGNVARYNFITPDLCDDMHDSTGCATTDALANGDTWLSAHLPTIFGSTAYKQGGAVFVTWDESEGGDLPIGMIVTSPFAKPGYSNTIAYNHGSTLRTVQEIFGVSPFLRAAATAIDLSDLFLAAGSGGQGGDGGKDGGTDSGGASCAHAICATGAKLVKTCDPCVTQVCAQDAFCCSSSWDSACVSEVSSICGQSCP